MENLKQLLKEGDKAIQKIKDQQTLLIYNYMKDEYNLIVGTILNIPDKRIVVVGFEYNPKVENSILIKYRVLKYNNALDKYVYTYSIKKQYEINGKYTGKI